jgi:hypothetical protein
MISVRQDTLPSLGMTDQSLSVPVITNSLTPSLVRANGCVTVSEHYGDERHAHVHRPVDCRVLCHLHHRISRFLGPHLDVENMLPVEPHKPLLVLLRINRALALMAPHHVLAVLRPPRAQICECRPPQRIRSGAVREDEVPEPLWPMRRDVLNGERDAPGLPEQVKVAVDAEVLEEVVQFGDEERRCEKSRGLVAHMSGRACAELVVQDDWTAVRLVHVSVREHVRVGYAWATVKNYERPRGGFEVAKDCV